MSLNRSFDGGAYTRSWPSVRAFSRSSTVAAGGTSSTGVQIDRNWTDSAGNQPLSRYYSCAAVVNGFFTAVSSQQNASVVVQLQHSSDGTSWDNLDTGRAATANFGATSSGYASLTTAGNEAGYAQGNYNLVNARRYLRVVLDSPTFSGSSTGQLLDLEGHVVFTGKDENS